MTRESPVVHPELEKCRDATLQKVVVARTSRMQAAQVDNQLTVSSLDFGLSNGHAVIVYSVYVGLRALVTSIRLSAPRTTVTQGQAVSSFNTTITALPYVSDNR
jgi:hypothetical protein